jgi:hypothetical protein
MAKSKESTTPAAVEVAVEKEEKKDVSTFQRLRGSKNFRLGLILVLLIIVGILFVLWEKARIALAIAFIALLAALGLEVSQNDFDLGELMRTKSFEESKVSRDESGNILFDKEGNITTDSKVGKKADDYNCDDFTYKAEAQSFFQKVGGTNNDLNRLDGDKDGQACESLRVGEKE